MVTRVTNRILINNSLTNIFRLSENMEKTQLRIATGKRINKLSDDPVRVSEILNFRSNILQNTQFIRNINQGKLLLNTADSALNDITLQLHRAREIAISQASGTATATTRGFNAIEVDNIISQILSSANIQVGNKYVFSGQKVTTSPFSTSASGAVYLGDRNELSMEIDKNSTIGTTIPGSDVLATDMDPGIDSNTLISDLNKGDGASAGSFTITDRAGNSATITITSGMTISNVISAINSASVNVTASINSSNTGISITDTNSSPTGNLIIAESGSGTTASDLGISGNIDGDINGLDLDPQMTTSTSLSLMKGGTGLTLTSISIINGSASGAVSFSSASTVGDVINAINNSGLNVTASINSAGNGIAVSSNSSSTTAIVNEVGSGSSAADLGIMGSNNILSTLLALKEALEKNDSVGIAASIDNIKSGVETTASQRGKIGARVNRLETIKDIHEQRIVDTTENLSDVEDADFVKEQMDFLAFQNAFNATLNVTSRIIQQSLLDFIR